MINLEEFLLQLREDLNKDDSRALVDNAKKRIQTSQHNYEESATKTYRYIASMGNINALKTLIAISKYEKEQEHIKATKKRGRNKNSE